MMLELCERFSCYRNVATVVGTVYIVYILLKRLWGLGSVFCAYFLAPCGISRLNLKKYGSWAIITGASEGIGRGYALELARLGLNVVIMSRSEEKLKKVEEEIESKYPDCNVRIVAVDFTKGQSVYEDIQSEISDLDIGVLVNNVGMGSGWPDMFGNHDKNRYRDVIEVNCQAMIQMTHLVLPKMVEKNKGIIVNLSSLVAVHPFPLVNIYSATKVFVKYFSTALQTEYKRNGIIVQGVYPGFVATAMTGIKQPKWWAPNPVAFTRSAVATIGVQQHTSGCLVHEVQRFVSGQVPEWLHLRLSYIFLKNGKKAQLRKKAQREKNQ